MKFCLTHTAPQAYTFNTRVIIFARVTEGAETKRVLGVAQSNRTSNGGDKRLWEMCAYRSERLDRRSMACS